MKAIIMGCGRTGRQICRLMAKNGHDITVIDEDVNALEQLGADFKGQKICGVGFDRNILLQAGIEQAEAFAATSPSDNMNIIAARIARNIFHVPRVVARLYDPKRAEIYKRLGLVTISMINWGAERIFELLTHDYLDPIMSFGKGEVILTSIEIPSPLEGRTVRDISIPGEIVVGVIIREDEALIPSFGTEFRKGDTVHLTVHVSAMDRLQELLGL
jgi:trk system potassium uptake protein TrkA